MTDLRTLIYEADLDPPVYGFTRDQAKQLEDAILSKWTLTPKGGPDGEQVARDIVDTVRTEIQAMIHEDMKPGGLLDEITAMSAREARCYQPTPPAPAALGTMSERERRLEQALKDIAGGCFDNATTIVLAGNWQGAFNALQNIAATALAYTPTPEPGRCD